MCAPGIIETVKRRLAAESPARRNFIKGAALAGAAALAAAPGCARVREKAPFGIGHLGRRHAFDRAIDLTHTHSADFPTYFGSPGLEVKSLYSFAKSGFNLGEWHLNEHSGTHLDAPLHFSADQNSAAEIPVGDLVLPLAIIDIRAKAADSPDAQVTPDDIKFWETHYGQIPENACVAMLSGWGEFTGGGKFRNTDADGVRHFPGFHIEAAQMLIERNARGIAVDTLSLDYGLSKDFAVHYEWLPTNRWGLECVANLDQVPPRGAMIVVGAPKVKGATGGLSRLIALA